MALDIAVVVIYGAAMIPMLDHLRDLPRADVTFTNDTVWNIGVDLIEDDGSRLPLSTLKAESTNTVEEIIEPGRVWRFRWTFRSHEIVRTEISDADLRAGRYRVSVPQEVTDILRAEGAPPAP